MRWRSTTTSSTSSWPNSNGSACSHKGSTARHGEWSTSAFASQRTKTERRFFREIFYQVSPRTARMSGFRSTSNNSKDRHGYDPDTLEQQFIDWSLDRLITFSSSRRLRRVQASQTDSTRRRACQGIRALETLAAASPPGHDRLRHQ